MDHIPDEILHLVYIQLNLKDRLQCTLVCRRWYNNLDQCSLLYNMYFRGNLFPRFISMLEWLPHRGAQVEHLTLDNCLGPDFDKRELCNMFPKLRKLKLFSGNHIDREDNYISTPFHFQYPTSKLESIRDYGHCELARQLAVSGLCGRLKYLELNLRGSTVSQSSDVVVHLKNMPNLESFCLASALITSTHLETIHVNLPSIISLKISCFIPTAVDIPHNVTPATLVTKLELIIEAAEDKDAHVQFYKYLSKKYPSVDNFKYNDRLLALLDSDYAMEVYRDGLFSFLRNIGSQIDTFSFDSYFTGVDAFEKFDTFGMKLKKLTISLPRNDAIFFEELAHSQQSKYLRELRLCHVLPTPLNLMTSMKVIEQLRIDCTGTRKAMNFSQFIKVCPATLTTLYARSVKLKFNKIPSNTTYINDLQLWDVDLTPNLAKTIETNLPNLSTLVLGGTLTRDVNISLPNHNLKRIRFSTMYREGQRNGFSIHTLCDDRLQLYSRTPSENRLGNTWSFILPKPMPVSKEDYIDPFTFSFSCASVKKILLSAFPIKNSF